MDIDAFMRDPLSRRRFFRLSGVSVVGSSAVFLTACGGQGSGGANDQNSDQNSDVSEPGSGDVALLNAALDLENTAVAAYTAGAPLLKGDALAYGKQFLEHEQEHVAGLTQAIKDLGGRPNRKKESYEFPELRTQSDVLKFAVDLENTAVAAYIDVMPKLNGPDLRATAAAIVTNEAEHISVLLGALGLPQVPSAFVTGEVSA